ncbi:glycosyltransferase family 4 protein [Thalassospira lohafexi]|uniref:Glycosyl transferase family 1 n=1 Tax=Thalassospira lohafexi TaxID=744227 RepID=A0A2N3L6X7_9PROT|nr:glycosyltransferase family 4 protein [Thalassospira lohafexi]PKR58532.1 glycosyl transferase family 1 [Thalassospira lohafexi]
MQTSTVVVLSDTARNNGGAAKVALQSAIGLRQAGYRVIFVSGEGGTVDPALEASGAEIVSLNQSSISDPSSRHKAFLTGLWNHGAARGLRDILEHLDPTTTVVHLHSWTKVLSTSIIPVIRQGRFPLVLTLHDYFTVCPNGGFYDYKNGLTCHRKPLSTACLGCNCDARSPAHKMWRVTRQVIQHGPGHFPACVDAFISVSDFSQRILQPFLPQDTPIHRIPPPIECVKSPASQPHFANGLLFIGRLSPEKGPGLLAAAAREAGVQVTFVGDGELKDILQTSYPEHKFTGWLSFSDILPLIDQTRALVLPSLWYETLGLTVLECAARGVPAVIADACAATDVVTHEETGLLFTSGDQSSLAQTINRLTDKELVERLGITAYQRFWATPPTLEKHIAELLDVYEMLNCQHVLS